MACLKVFICVYVTCCGTGGGVRVDVVMEGD